jgi:16S rRNA (guanine966-N2)-methyltransferase
MLTIQGGAWSGRRLKALERKGLRPSSGRVKASLFSILESLEWKRSGEPSFSGWRCLDLFAGVGGLGLEILSRGAAHCFFVEKDRAHARVLQENISGLGCEAQTSLLVEPVEKGGWKGLGPFQLILLDPPYAESKLVTLLEGIASDGDIAPGGVILFEHDPKVSFPDIPGLKLHSRRKIGPAGLSVFLGPES